MRFLIIGGGGREHAIAWKLKKDDPDADLIAVPGNGGISEIAECIDVKIENPGKIADIAGEKRTDYVIIGPELPLAQGLADECARRGIAVFGPVMKGARLEASKIFAKEFMAAHNIPTAPFNVAEDYESCIKILQSTGYPCVMKYDGLAAGKGVRVVEDKKSAFLFAEEIFLKNIFAASGNKVVIEDFLEGDEMSYIVFTDSESYVPMVSSRDHKRAFDGDKGPNTGGMGCYAPHPMFYDRELNELIKKSIVEPTIKGLQSERIDYRGVLYFGIMLSGGLPYLLEYNVRFGDPETQTVLPLLETPLVEIISAVSQKKLNKVKVGWIDQKSVCVILASSGYPGSYSAGKKIKGLENSFDSIVFHAGTVKKSGEIFTSGGRVIGVTALGSTFEAARKTAYKTASKVDYDGKFYRKDIGIDLRG